MTLPDLWIQVASGRLGWAVVLASVLLAVASRRAAPGRVAVAGTVCACLLAMGLPNAWSPAYWLALAFQWPSALLVALSGASVARRWSPVRSGDRVLPSGLAAALAVAGAGLYLDCTGWLAFGWYATGFGPVAAPLAALLAGAIALACMVWGRSVATAAAVLAAVGAFAVWRLPTGNVWDAFMDPFLFGWAVVTLFRRLELPGRRVRGARPARGEPATVF